MMDFMLDQTADVYTEAATSGRYTVLAKSGLPCRLLHVSLRPATTTRERAELASERTLMFDASYIMPEQCQVEIDGVRWAPQPGTFQAPRDMNSETAYRECQVIRQQVTAF